MKKRDGIHRMAALGTAALLLAASAAASTSDLRVGVVEIPNSKDLASQTLDLAGAAYEVGEETVMTGLLGERIRLRDIVTAADAGPGGEPHEIRFSATRSATGSWLLTEVTIIGVGYSD